MPGSEPTMRGSALLRLLLVSIAVNALLGIWALVAEDFGQTQGKVLATSFLVSAAMIVVLINLPAGRRRYLWPVPPVAGALGAAAIVWFIVLMWAEVDREVPFKLGGSGLLLSAAGSVAGLMTLVAPPPRLSKARAVHLGLLSLLTALILVLVWFERGGDTMARIIGVVSVLTAAITLGIPVGRRVQDLRTRVGESTVAVGFCPVCGSSLSEPVGEGSSATCDSCGTRFAVTVDHS